MAKANSSSTLHAVEAEGATSITDDLRTVIAPAFTVKALLQGALALIEDPGADTGDVWAAREIIEAAMLKVQEVYVSAHDLKVYERIEALEGGAS